MLISCPKCHSIYEIADDLVGKTGQNFRCHACANVWHVMREDAIDYEQKVDEKPYVEAIPVSEPPHRHYPANKEPYTVPADSKSGVHVLSSKEVIKQQGDPDYIPPKPKQRPELTLTSDQGTSFTITPPPEEIEPEEDNLTPYLFDESEIHFSKKDRLLPEKPFKGYRKTCLLLILLMLMALTVFLRRDIVAFYPKAETWYNKIWLSGLSNPEYLTFENITLSETTFDNKPMLNIKAQIVNNSHYSTHVPPITISGQPTTFSAAKKLLTAHEKTNMDINIPLPQENAAINLILGFQQP